MTNPSPQPQPPNFWDTLLNVLPGGGTTTNASDALYTTPTASTVLTSKPIKTRRTHRTHLTPGNRVHAFRPEETACAICRATRPWPEAAETIIEGTAVCGDHAALLGICRTYLGALDIARSRGI